MSAISAAAKSLGGISATATALGVSAPAVSQWINGDRPIPPERCAELERRLYPKVTVRDLCPDVRWARIPDPTWPHPEGRPCLDIAAPAVAES